MDYWEETYIDSAEKCGRSELALVSETEIGNLALESVGKENIAGGEILVKEALASQILHSLGDLIGEKDQIGVVEALYVTRRGHRVGRVESAGRVWRLERSTGAVSSGRRGGKTLLELADHRALEVERELRVLVRVLAQPVLEVAVRAVLDEHAGEAARDELFGETAQQLNHVQMEAYVRQDLELLQQRVYVAGVYFLIFIFFIFFSKEFLVNSIFFL